MHKTISASIGSSLFTVEESAYAALDAYLSSIRSHFGASAESDEIVSDIESRIAEEFAEALGTKRKVILKNDVDAVIARMGTVEDFRKFDGEPADARTEATDGKLRLYRDADDQMIGGVCSGIAKYFGIDPLVVRIVFLLSLLIGGFGIVAYVLLWIFLPEARTTAEKVEMTGGRVTLSAIQQRIDAVVSPEQRKGVVARVIRFPFAVIGSVLRGVARVARFVFPILGRIAGGFITIGSSIALAFATFLFFAILLNPGSPYIGFPLLETVGWTAYAFLLGAAYFAAVLPLVLILLVGSSLVLMRNLFTAPVAAGLFSNWLIALVVLGVTVFSVAPKLEASIHENVNETTREYTEFRDFDAVRSAGIQRINVTRGDTFSVAVTGTEDAIARAGLSVEDGTFAVTRGSGDGDGKTCMILCFDDDATINVTMPALSRAEAADASRMTIDGFSGATLELLARDVARIDGKITATTLTAKVQDAARITLSGTAGMFTVSAGDVARVDALEVTAQRVNAIATDASRIEVNAVLSLTGSASDVSRIEYRTDPSERLGVDTTDAASVGTPGTNGYGDHDEHEYEFDHEDRE